MTRPKANEISWDTATKTAAEARTSHSQQRRKAIAKPLISWEDDAHTVVAPPGAPLPAAAFKDGPLEPELAAPVAQPASSATSLPVRRFFPDPEPLFALERPLIPAQPARSAAAAAPVVQTASAAELSTQTAVASHRPPPKRRRGLLIGVLILAVSAGSYGAASVMQKRSPAAVMHDVQGWLVALGSKLDLL